MDDKYPLALPKGTVLAGQYVIDKVLGQGGFGITYRALDHNTNKKVAVKEFFPDSMATRSASTVIPFTGERGDSFNYGKECFLQEAQTLAQFLGNENIVRIYTYFEENGTAYFVMEYIEGKSFDVYIKERGGRVRFDEAYSVLGPIMDALAVVHSKGIVHRDVTPDNIYITSAGEIKLLDFGAARYSLGDKSRSLDVVLKHGFAPKEQYTRRGKQGPYTDVYALGASFYYAITGKRPPDSVERMDEDELVPPSTLGAEIGRSAEQAILKALSVQPADRFQTMTEFKDAMFSSVKTDVEEKVYTTQTQYNTTTYGQENYGNSAYGGQGQNAYGRSAYGSQGQNAYGNQSQTPYGGQGQNAYGQNAYGAQGGRNAYGSQGQNAYGAQGQTPYGGNRNQGAETPYGSQGQAPYGGQNQAGKTVAAYGQGNSPYGQGGGGVSYNQSPSGYNMQQPQKKSKTGMIIGIVAGAVSLLIITIVVIAMVRKNKEKNTTEYASYTTTEYTYTTTEATTVSTYDPPATTETVTTEATTEATTAFSGTAGMFQEVQGARPGDISNMGVVCIDANGQEYDADYVGQRILRYSKDGNDTVLLNGSYVWSLSIYGDNMYFVKGQRAYTMGKDGSGLQQISELSSYEHVEAVYVTEETYLIYQYDKDSNLSRLVSVEKGSGDELGTIKFGRETNSDEKISSRHFTFANGWLFYLLKSEDGITYSSTATQRIWKVAAGDIEFEPEAVYQFSKEATQITIDGDYLYYLYKENDKVNGIGMANIYDFTKNADYTWDENEVDFSYLTVYDSHLAVLSKKDDKCMIYSEDPDIDSQNWTLDPVYQIDEGDNFVFGLCSTKAGYYFIQTDVGVQFVDRSGNGFTNISER
ncbi:MAG: protein kinase [Eubacterium sp.]|nr:protein kinase [Eubacterium sp.]